MNVGVAVASLVLPLERYSREQKCNLMYIKNLDMRETLMCKDLES